MSADAAPAPCPFSLSRGVWAEVGDDARAIRRLVFIEEQNVPEALEWDGLDPQCVHVVATAGGGGIGTGRLSRSANIGRMAVVASWRRKGVGSAILLELLEAARQAGHPTVTLSAQCHALQFYARYGFSIVSPQFFDAGIPHRKMRLNLNQQG